MVPDVAGGLTEEKVNGKAFELVFAFDEVITTGGLKESITLPQVPAARRLAVFSPERPAVFLCRGWIVSGPGRSGRALGWVALAEPSRRCCG